MSEARARTPRTAAALVVAVTVVSSLLLALAGLPSAVLFGGLIGGMAHALTSETPLAVPAPAFRVGQALIGVTIGCVVSLDALRAMGHDAVDGGVAHDHFVDQAVDERPGQIGRYRGHGPVPSPAVAEVAARSRPTSVWRICGSMRTPASATTSRLLTAPANWPSIAGSCMTITCST